MRKGGERGVQDKAWLKREIRPPLEFWGWFVGAAAPGHFSDR